MTKRFKQIGEDINPILVKELIQGMRTKTFVSSFLITQALLFLVTLIIVGNSSGSNSSSSQGWFWFGVTLPFMLLMPMRGLDSINTEVKSKTLEMLFLSNLNSKQIMRGKFFSHAIQILLLASTVLPYMVFRYFAGEVDLIKEIAAFTFTILYGLLITAVTVTVSAFSHKNRLTHMLRAIAVIIGSIFLYGVVYAFLYSFISERGALTSNPFNLTDFFVLLLQLSLLFDFILLTGSTQISPRDENLWPAKRLHCLAQIAIYTSVHFFTENSYIIAAPLFCLAITALEGIFAPENNLRTAIRKALRLRFFNFIFFPSRAAAGLWFNFTMIVGGLMLIVEISSHNNIHFHQIAFLLPVIIGGLYLTAVCLLEKIPSVKLPAAMLTWLTLPMIFFIIIIKPNIISYNNNDSVDLLKAVLGTMSIYGLILMPHSAVRILEILKKRDLPILYTAISYACFLLGCTILIILNENKVTDMPPLTPMDILSVIDQTNSNNYKPKRWDLLFVYGQYLAMLAVLTYSSVLSCRNGEKLRRSTKQMQTAQLSA